jgi:hypothetical protein
MSKFIPKVITESKGTFVLIDDVFCAEAGIEWAKEHLHNIKIMCGNYTCATELYYYLQEAGYRIEFVKRTLSEYKIEMFDTAYCYLESNNK